jgi:uncharacterized coiled-coil protein SlyX
MNFAELVSDVKGLKEGFAELKERITNFLKGDHAGTGAAPRLEAGAITEQIKGFQARVEQVEAASAQHEKDLATANRTVAERDAEITRLKAELQTANGKVTDLEAKAKTGARQAADILATTSVDPVAATTTPSAQVGEKDFVAIVKEQIAAGKKKADAMMWAVTNHPDQYAKAKKEGKMAELHKL